MKEQIVYKKVEELHLNKRNPRKNDKAVPEVMKSIKEFGFKNPLIVDKQGTIWCGNTRYKASLKLGLKEVPCIVVEDLTEDQMRKYALLDNKTNEIADWDNDLLAEELNELDLSNYDLDWKLPEIKDEEIEPEVPFTEVMNEESNYILLQFKTDIDWLQAQSLFNIKPKQAYSTRKDGKIGNKMKRIGTGRVIDGAEFINGILGLKK